jgi:hypothetical protein
MRSGSFFPSLLLSKKHALRLCIAYAPRRMAAARGDDGEEGITALLLATGVGVDEVGGKQRAELLDGGVADCVVEGDILRGELLEGCARVGHA